MANPFYVPPANALQALMMGVEGYGQGQKSMQSAALQEAGQLYAQGDIAGAQAAAARGGNLQALMGFAGLQNQERDFGFRQTEAQRSQGNTERGFGLQEKQIAATAGNQTVTRDLARQQFEHAKEVANRAEIKTVKDANGNEVLVRIARDGTPTPIPVPGQGGEPNNPFLTGGAMNEAQSKDALYANRMLNSERVFRDPSVISASMDMTEKGRAKVPIIGNYMVSDNFQRFDQAKRDFINATLRRESGAVISDSEFANADKQYFPQPGDSEGTLKQKQQNRVEAIKGIGAGGGKGYRPEYGFDAQGGMIDRKGGSVETASAPPKGAVAALQASPKLRDQFDQKYGKGAAAKVLGY